MANKADKKKGIGGRREVADKKIRVVVFIHRSKITAIGGMRAMQDYLISKT